MDTEYQWQQDESGNWFYLASDGNWHLYTPPDDVIEVTIPDDVVEGGSWHNGQAPLPPRRPSSPSSMSSRPSTFHDDTFSIFSKASTATSMLSAHTSNSNRLSRTQPFTLPGASGAEHDPSSPARPMLVMFTRDSATDKKAPVTVDIDQDTSVNPDRCNCRRVGAEGETCNIASIESHVRLPQDVSLSVRRSEGHKDNNGWDVAQLATGRRGESPHATAPWKNVRRISIMFSTAERRARFGGTPGLCSCGETCLEARHKGHFGLIRESWKLQMNDR
ncbi:aspartate aminotransferase protein [Colletotrichum plurivorum]|uniref:Aspartate aminotransferase protein n=1 Tax=Colletotrichum plurivorum TaxID=2175906 RepID=A0A8H6KLQ4_9PEZI|nr:aspartate aminotransferase protein [Colletotrichum plurivorum]